MASDKLMRASQIGGALAPIGVLVSYLSLAYNSGAWPYSTHSWVWPVIGAVAALAGLPYPMIGILRRRELRPWPVVICLLLVSAGSVITASSIPHSSEPPTAPATPQDIAKLDITSPKPREQISGDVQLAGRFQSPLRSGETLWVFVSDGDTGAGDSSTRYLQLGPCSVNRADNTWSCPNVALVRDPKHDRTVTLSLVSAEAEQARLFVQQLADGAKVQQRNSDCEALGCAKDATRDPRNYSGLPGGPGITFLDSRPIVLTKGR